MNGKLLNVSPYYVLVIFALFVGVLMFASVVEINAGPVPIIPPQFWVGLVAGAVVDYNSCDLNIIWGCGGSNSGGNDGNGGGSCGEGEQLCAGTCIPADADCCARFGSASYCATQSTPTGPIRTYCSPTGGQCRTTPCVDNADQTCNSPSNSCGLTSAGRYSCEGTCPAGAPPDSSCPTPDISITATGPGGSRFVNQGQACTIRWTTTNTTSCTLSGPGVSVTGTSGQIDTPPIQSTSTYTLSCQNGTVVTASQEVICYLTPHFEEF